jgi:phage shock protein C
MYCTQCGVQLNETARFCSACGQATNHNTYAHAPQPPYTRLSRPREDRKIAGVCAGFARYLGVDVTLVRLIAVVLIFIPVPCGLIAYLVAWIIMPNDPIPFAAPGFHPAGGPSPSAGGPSQPAGSQA